jgi:hypothetical protein
MLEIIAGLGLFILTILIKVYRKYRISCTFS